MKVKNLTLALAGSLLLAGAAQAAIVGLQFDQVGDSLAVNDGVGNNSVVDVYRLYAISDDAANDVVTIQSGQGLANGLNYRWSSDATTPFDNLGGGFFNQAFGGDGPTFGPLVAAFPDILNDTYITIGIENSIAGPTGAASFAPDTSVDLTGSFVMSDGNNGGVDSADGLGAMFIIPSDVQGFPDGSNRVLLAQIAVLDGEMVSVAMNVQWGNQARGAGSGYFTASTIPAPGAFALLGLAGLACVRRRRK